MNYTRRLNEIDLAIKKLRKMKSEFDAGAGIHIHLSQGNNVVQVSIGSNELEIMNAVETALNETRELALKLARSEFKQLKELLDKEGEK